MATDPLIEGKLERLRNNSANADKKLAAKAGALGKAHIGTSYTSAERIKALRLVEKNREEANWPGARTHYEIDRDQVLFHDSFVRLARKTQVFTGPHSAAYRNRLMHTLEVVQLTRSVAESNYLNVDLAEAIAYGHDIGHTPFGHAGEDALDLCLCEYFIRLCLSDFFKSQGFGDHLRPHAAGLTPIGNADARHLDNAIWLLVQKLAHCDPGGPAGLSATAISCLAHEGLHQELLRKKILTASGILYRLGAPLTWERSTAFDHVRTLTHEFWLQPDSTRFFSHNVHSLRVLLCNPMKDYADLTKQCAYGILAHPHRGKYPHPFVIQLPTGEVTLSHDKCQTPEAFAVGCADDICFVSSDITDAGHAGLMIWGELQPNEEVVFRELGGIQSRCADFPPPSQRIQHCEENFDFGANPPTHKLSRQLDEAKQIIKRLVHSKLLARQDSARRVIRDLFWFFCVPPREHDRRPVEAAAYHQFAQAPFWTGSPERQATDYVASLTDDEAVEIHTALFSPENADWERHFAPVKQNT